MSRQGRYKRRKNSERANVGTIRACGNPALREACRLDLAKFLVEYFPQSTGRWPFSADHLRVIARLQACALDGGMFINAMPRGFAKTTISENAAMWAVLYGHRKFVAIFGADSSSAGGNIDSIKTELETNDLLYRDFPEAIHPIRALEGKPQRCSSQSHTPGDVEGFEPAEETQERQTFIEWTADTLVLPTIIMPDGPAVGSGAILCAYGILAASRGMKHKRPDGTQQRPDMLLIDDPQTDASAASLSQIGRRIQVVQKNLLRLGEHGKKIAAVMNATVIESGDMIDQMLDSRRFPAWSGERIAMVKTLADSHDAMWLDRYAGIRSTYDKSVPGDQKRAHQSATEFYRQNREAMDAGAVVAWEHCYDRDTELSAIQHAYNILIDDGEEVFESECQNKPRERVNGDGRQLATADLGKKLSHVARGVVPRDCDKLTAFVDVQGEALFWIVVGWKSSDFSGYVVDYGVWPEQQAAYFTLSSLRQKLSDHYAGETEAIVYAGLLDLAADRIDRQWPTESGGTMTVSRCLVDYNWEPSQTAVFNASRTRSSVMIPSKGMGRNVAQKAFSVGAKAAIGETRGAGWREIPGAPRRAIFHTDYWKKQVRDGLLLPANAAGSLHVFGTKETQHRLLFEHFCSEYSQRVTIGDATIDEFKLKPGRPDNHWWDGLVGAAVAASMVGAQTAQHRIAKGPPKPKRKFSEIQRDKAQRLGLA